MQKLLILGGYGVVGSRATRLIRSRNPDLRLVLAGRHVENAASLAREVDAEVVRVDVAGANVLDGIPGDVTAALGVVTDPNNTLLREVIGRGIPYADLNRAGLASIADATLVAAMGRPTAPILLAGSFYCGLTALTAAFLHGRDANINRVDITILSSSNDEVGPNSWGFADRLAWPYYPSAMGHRRVAHPLTEAVNVRCADGTFRSASLLGTMEQTTLPILLGVPTVESRIAMIEGSSLGGLRFLKRTGLLRLLSQPKLAGVKAAIFNRQGTGGIAGLSVTATSPSGQLTIDLLSPNGQVQLSAAGATCAAELLLSGQLRSGLCFPEQYVDACNLLDLLRHAGIVVTGSDPRITVLDPSESTPRVEAKETSK